VGVKGGRGARPFSVLYNAFFLQNHLGGIGNYAYHLIAHLRRQRPDWDITLLVHAGAAPHFRSLEGVRLLVKDIPSRNLRLAWFQLWFAFRSGRYDLIHSVGNMGMLFGRAPQVITIHDLYERVSPERFSVTKRFLMRILISISGARAKAIVAVSENTRRDIGRFYPRLAGKTRVVYSGNKFPVVQRVPEGPRRDFVFVGTLEPGKNLPHILEAFARFPGRGRHRLKVVGAKGWGQSRIPGLIASLGIGREVDFLGYVPDDELSRIYAASVALIVASSYEGFGLPVIEAMAGGCPVICARNSSLIEAGGDAALFFATGDIAGLAERMRELATDADLRRSCAEKGLAHAARFTWEAAAAGTAAVYGTPEGA
jgi:glycosyltransferase involved in cell wall biosynthesis